MNHLPDKNDNELSIILPVFNESAALKKVVHEIHAHTQHLGIRTEIIIVNDGSTDGTSAIIDQIRISLPDIKLITHQKNVGYGQALRSGIKAAQKEWILLMDADDQIHIDSLNNVWARRNECDLLLGYRLKRSDRWYRRILGKMGNTVSNMLLKRNLTDINCGFKIFRRRLIQPLTLCSSGGIIYFEIFYRLFRNDPSLRSFQFPIRHYPRRLGKSTGASPRVIGKIFIEGLMVLLNLPKGGRA